MVNFELEWRKNLKTSRIFWHFELLKFGRTKQIIDTPIQTFSTSKNFGDFYVKNHASSFGEIWAGASKNCRKF